MEIFRALGCLADPPTAAQQPVATALELGTIPEADAHYELFDRQLYPYASVYLGAEGMLGGEARDRVAGFWRALEEVPPGEADHITVVLALYARLAELEETTAGPALRALWRRSRTALLWEHLVSWLPPFLLKLDELAPPFYRRWGGLLAAALLAERERLGEPDRLPLHLREAPSAADPRHEGGDAFIASLLAPVRSGFILTRSDLARAAARFELGARIGERRATLADLLAQAPGPFLTWLSRHARRFARLESRLAAIGGTRIASFWTSRADASAALLAHLARLPERHLSLR